MLDKEKEIKKEREKKELSFVHICIYYDDIYDVYFVYMICIIVFRVEQFHAVGLICQIL